MRKFILLLAMLIPFGLGGCLISAEQQSQLDQLTATAEVQNSYMAVLRDLTEMRASGVLGDDVYRQVDPHVQAADAYLKAMMDARRAQDDIAFAMAQRNFNEAKAGMVYWRNRLAGGGI